MVFHTVEDHIRNSGGRAQAGAVFKAPQGLKQMTRAGTTALDLAACLAVADQPVC